MEKNTSKKPFGFSKLIVYICLILLAITIIVPVAWVFLASVKQNKEFYGNPWTLPEKLYFQNFVDAWTKADMGSYILNSVIVTALAIAMLIAVALPAAYVLSRFKFRTCKFWNLLFMAGLFINVSYIVVPIFLMLNNWDKSLRQMIGRGFFLNNLFILAVVYMATALPFTIYLLSGYFSGLAKDFEEAAYVDGAGYFTTMVKIIFPMAKPSIVTIILFNFLSFWNEYVISMTLLTNEKFYHMLLVIIIGIRGKAMLQRTLGSGWGILLPGIFITGLAFAGLSIDAWKVLIVLGLLLTSLMLYHKRLRHFVLLPSCVALISGMMLVMMNLNQG